MDICKDVESEILHANTFIKTYNFLQHIKGRRFPITLQGYTTDQLLDGTEFQILLDTGVIKSILSKNFI